MTLLLNAQARQANHVINEFHHLKVKIALINKDIWYNNQCLTNNVIPNYVSIKPLVQSQAAKVASNVARKLWVKTEIKMLYAKKQNLYNQLYNTHLEILDYNLSFMLDYHNEKFKKELLSTLREKQNRLDQKLHKLISNKFKSYENDTNQTHTFYKRTENLSNVTFNLNEQRLLDKGLKHNASCSYSNVNNLKQTVLDSERALNCVNPNERNHIRHLVSEKLMKIKQNPAKIDKAELQTIRTLKKKLIDNEVIVVKADKGNTTVLMQKDQYIEKTEKFIVDNNIELSKKDPTVRFQNNIKAAIKNVNLIMNKTDKVKVINMNPRAPNLRALPKIHKDGIPIRPIVNYRKAPAYKLASFLQRYLKENIKLENNRSISNSIKFIETITQLNFDKDSKMASYDVKSMYTQIPIADTINLVKENLINNQISIIETDEVCSLLKVVLGQNYFSFNNKMYLQTEGLGMGAPLSGILADIYMNSLENKIINEVLNQDASFKWLRYVDDVWVKFNSSKITSETILNKCNSLNNSIQFTKEDEINNKLCYLDIEIYRKTNKVTTSVHRKPTTTSHTLHIKSNHPEQHKRAAFNCYVNRALKIPNTPANKIKEMKIIEQIAIENGYNKRWLKQIIDKNMAPKIKSPNTEEKKFVTFTYINKQTDKITQLFRNKFKLNIAYRTNNKIGQKLGKHNLNHSNIFDKSGVYRLNCNEQGCFKQYVGQSGREFKIRFKEHKQSVRHGRPSAFGTHAFDADHKFGNIEDMMEVIKVLDKGQDLNTYEAIEIFIERNNTDNLNEQESFGNNPLFMCFDQPRTHNRHAIRTPVAHGPQT